MSLSNKLPNNVGGVGQSSQITSLLPMDMFMPPTFAADYNGILILSNFSTTKQQTFDIYSDSVNSGTITMSPGREVVLPRYGNIVYETPPAPPSSPLSDCINGFAFDTPGVKYSVKVDSVAVTCDDCIKTILASGADSIWLVLSSDAASDADWIETYIQYYNEKDEMEFEALLYAPYSPISIPMQKAHKIVVDYSYSGGVEFTVFVFRLYKKE